MRRPGVAVSVATALLVAALFAGDSVWTALAVLSVAGGWGALALVGRAPQPGGGAMLLGVLLATAAWAGLSVMWSVAPDRSWAELDRTLVYVAFLAVGLLAGARGPTACRWAAAALIAALGAAVVWALAGKAIPALFPDGGRTARLRDPIGYWNALALAADVLLVLALQLAAAGRSRATVAGGTALAYAATVAVFLAASRAGVAAALIGVVLWLWLGRDRVPAALLALAAALPAAAVAAWAFSRPALVDDAYPRADRVADGAWFGLLLLAGAVLVAFAALELRRRPLPPDARRATGRLLAWLALAGVLAVAVVAVANAGRIADEFRGGEVTNEPGRLGSLSSNNRLDWWGEAWDIFSVDPLAGAGAGTFEVARKRYRETASPVTEPHSVPLQFLAGTGLVGLALFVALVAAAAAAAVGGRRRLDGGERDAAAALSVALALWLAHALVDYDWDFVAVTGPVLFAAGVLAAAGRPARASAGPTAAAAAVALALAAAVSVVTPWLAERSVRDVGAALDRGDLAAAADSAERAKSLDPLSPAPLFARARVEEARGDEDAALATYREAVRLQPENPETWYELGLYEFDRGDRCSAYVHLNEAYTLDPAGRQWVPGGPLDQSLEWVNEPGNC
ncbi:MAG TPA: O-antigen ligase family protein [Gaiellaceae bacterium]|nr:O-antigen ligase family protein [Gaiellaceae bacterium]